MKNKRLVGKFFCFFCFFATFLYALEPNKIQSLEANFIQTLTLEDNHKISYEGKIFLKSPKSALWQYTSPIVKEVYIEGNTLIIYEPKLEQATFSTLKKELNLLTLLKEAKKIDTNHYEATLSNQVYFIELKNDLPSIIRYTDELNNKVEIQLKDTKINELKNENIFDFTPPSNIDVIYQ
ncbi:LolA-like outer membrane lipoprotein chaperone [Helicobacter burdigaliensis]